MGASAKAESVVDSYVSSVYSANDPGPAAYKPEAKVTPEARADKDPVETLTNEVAPTV